MSKKERGSVLLSAYDTINGEKVDEYGNPENSFDLIAEFWSTYLSNKSEYSLKINNKDVAVMMALMKIARIITGSDKSDSYIDCCGYIALASDMAKENEAAD